MFALSMSTTAQKNYQVNLKNGSIIRGEIIEKNDSSIKIQTKDGSIWSYRTDELESSEPYNPDWHSSKFYNSTTIGIMPSNDPGVSFQVVSGYLLNQNWNFGIGLGLERIGWNSYAPLFLEAKYNLGQQKSTPYFSVMAGYELSLSNSFESGGFTTGAKFGLDHFFTQHIGITTNIGYRYAYLKTQNGWWDDFVEIREINRLEFRLGLIFK
jgi:hypothetical protein